MWLGTVYPCHQISIVYSDAEANSNPPAVARPYSLSVCGIGRREDSDTNEVGEEAETTARGATGAPGMSSVEGPVGRPRRVPTVGGILACLVPAAAVALRMALSRGLLGLWT